VGWAWAGRPHRPRILKLSSNPDLIWTCKWGPAWAHAGAPPPARFDFSSVEQFIQFNAWSGVPSSPNMCSAELQMGFQRSFR
jgi:hypothetical protein